MEAPLVIKTFAGLESLLAEEVTALGASGAKAGKRAVYANGDLKTVYRINLCSRYALRVLQEVHRFGATDEKALYAGVQEVEWNQFLPVDGSLAVDAVAYRSNMDHTQYIALKTKDAIVDQFRDAYGKRPNVDIQRPTVRIHVHLVENNATVSLDSSGDSLHRRGYREEPAGAPLSEVLAAGLIGLTGWKGDRPLYDPFCGSGTLLTEAVLLARRIAPGRFREGFGFQRWMNFDAGLWNAVREAALAQELPASPVPVFGSDRSSVALSSAKSNLRTAGMERDIILRTGEFEQLEPPAEGCLLVMNPPYGERIAHEDIQRLYKGIGDTLKRQYAGSEAWILSANREAEKQIGLRPSKRIQVFNGPIECRFLKFELYRGSRRGGE